MQWNILSPTSPKSTQELTAILLENRKVLNVTEFLHPKNPLQLSVLDVGINATQMEKAVTRLQRAKAKDEQIVIYGDYDADGICATTVLWETLYQEGYTVLPFIPDREKHGYGLSLAGIEEILQKGRPDIVISVDNGIVAHEAWEKLRALGVFTILTDHHEPDETTPVADCIIHTTKLCGTTVAWMLAREISAKHTATLLDLCAIATIADQVPLLGANRAFAKFGIDQLNQTHRLGLELLIQAASLEKGSIDEWGINFGIAPRLNAMGRIGSALDALRALCTKKREKAEQLIGVLNDTNLTRQELTEELLQRALTRSEEWKEERIIIVEDTSFHEGVIGLIAGKLAETFHKPAIALSVGPTSTKGSARSVRGVHITNLLREFRQKFELEVGGHPMAAGLRINSLQVEAFKQALYIRAREVVDITLLEPKLEIDCALPDNLRTLETAQELQALAPFGSANPKPMFLFAKQKVLDVKLIGKDQQHLKILLAPKLSALAFGKGDQIDQIKTGESLDLVGYLQVNEWKGSRSVQLIVKDFRTADYRQVL